MKISIVTTAYNSPDGILKLCQTAMLDADKHDIDFYIFFHGKDEATHLMCKELEQEFPVKLFDYQQNRGLARSWNEGHFAAYEAGADAVFIANDDTYFTAGDVDKGARKAVACRDNYIISLAGYHIGEGKDFPTTGYSCFVINPISLEKVGCFDENIFPIYLEDIDHHRRATLAGLVEENCPDTRVYHVGSAAINGDPMLGAQNAMTHRLNIEYWYRKWGRTQDTNAGYRTPFNNPAFGMKIEYEDRHHPYGPGYDREDYEDLLARMR